MAIERCASNLLLPIKEPSHDCSWSASLAIYTLWIALIACDKNITGVPMGDDIFNHFRNRGDIAAVRYCFFGSALARYISSPPSSYTLLIATSVSGFILATWLAAPWKSQTPVS